MRPRFSDGSKTNIFRMLTGKPSTGLGLAIAKELVQSHKGKIWVESEEGRGSCFHVVFHKYTESRYFKEFFKEKIKLKEVIGAALAVGGVGILFLS